jgi:hypothetical protein
MTGHSQAREGEEEGDLEGESREEKEGGGSRVGRGRLSEGTQGRRPGQAAGEMEAEQERL